MGKKLMIDMTEEEMKKAGLLLDGQKWCQLKPNKYRAKRTEYGGVVYDSKAEAEYVSKELEWKLKHQFIKWWLRQVWIPLGPDFRTRVDFVVGSNNHPLQVNTVLNVYAVEVKGLETREFKKVRKLWPKYGPFHLEIVKTGKPVEIINGKA